MDEATTASAKECISQFDGAALSRSRITQVSKSTRGNKVMGMSLMGNLGSEDILDELIDLREDGPVRLK